MIVHLFTSIAPLTIDSSPDINYIPNVVISEIRNMWRVRARNVGWGIVAALFLLSSSAYSQNCAPGPEFVDTPHPAIGRAEEFVSHTEEITIERPLAVVLSAVDKPIKDTFKKTDSLPTVSGDYMLAKGDFGAPGSRRLTCLSDGGTVEEEVLESTQKQSSFHFRYVVWNYTSQRARPISYAVGDFLYSETSERRTHVTWTYSFRLKDGNFPGYLGTLGRFLFRKYFLEREYANLMRGVLNGYKIDAEQRP
jgi:hypothetical protein